MMDSRREISWLRNCALYFVHAVVAGIGVFLTSMFLGAGVESLNQKFGDSLFSAPIFPAEILLGFILGFAINRFLKSNSAKWAWILPAVWLFSDFPSSVGDTGWSYTLSYLFVGKCSDCVEVTFLVAPFYGSMAYSLGAWIALKRLIITPEQTEKPSLLKILLMVVLYSLAVVVGVFVFTFTFVLAMMLISHSVGALATTGFGRPYYAGEIVVALAGGLLIGPRIRPSWAKWVWVLPSIWLLVYMAYSARFAGEVSIAQYTWTHFFSGRCAANPNIACPQETFGTCPFLSSLAYSFGAWIMSHIQISGANVKSKPTPVSLC